MRKMRAQIFWTLAMLLGLAMGQAACAADEAPAAAPAADTAPVAAGKASSLSYGEFGRLTTLDPITGNDMISTRITELMFNGLVGINAKQQIVPELAESWDQSPDGLEYTFHLRKDVKWHPKPGEEAKPFTADDVIFTYNIMVNPRTVTSAKTRYDFIKEPTKVDDYTVRFTLKHPILNALPKFTFKIIPEFATSKSYLGRDDPFVQHPIGTGPYRYKETTATGEVVLEANPDYFKGAPKIGRFVAKPFADQNVMNQALMYGNIDMSVLVNPRNVPEIQGDKRLRLQSYSALSYEFFGYNMRNPLLADKRVRKAFTLAINRSEMLKSFYNNQGTVISGPFAPGSWAYNLDVKPLPYDPAAAEKLLNDAGFQKGGDGIMTSKDGKRLTLTLKVPIQQENEAVKRVVLAFKNYLQRVGAEVNVEFVEWQAWNDAVLNTHDFDIMYAHWNFDDASDITALFHSGEAGAGHLNFGGYSNPEVDSLLIEAKNTLDHEKRRTIYRKLHEKLADEAPYAFLWSLNNYAAYDRKVRAVQIHPYKFFSYADTWYIGSRGDDAGAPAADAAPATKAK